MNKITVRTAGMSCGMCEAHINDVIRSTFPNAKKVSSSHRKGESVFLLDGAFDAEKLRAAIDGTGYVFLSAESEPYEKKGLFRRG